ncbi:xanthine dehydrogenase family protein subunit M [Sphingobacterium sp. lm-10]|uniref:FAD binding domain-containing protein n=1 Tax=Sphingobacterium sp. lm-10 TaxID=2944904 RepID=UPI002021101F|nr:xanthine dehydrogenase family protein subunit M [Sphingobacterium sp. lm-10]MCL7986666.1 xanthine dehydrogenase family protein subunit M [Sphingobacterium sp. lm-10]
MRPFEYIKPKDSKEALRSKTPTGAYIAGGTNLVDLLKKNIAVPHQVLDVTQALSDSIALKRGGIEIGAMVRNTTAAINPAILEQFPLVSKAILAGASPQIRNMASIGGNLLQRTRCPYFYDTSLPCNKRAPGSGCGAYDGENRMSAVIGYSADCVAVHPSDLCVALAALDATVVVQDAKGKKKSILFKDFHRLPESTPQQDNTLPEGALISEVHIPKNAFHKHTAYLKIRDRDSYAFALVSVAAALQIDGNRIVAARLASGGVAHKPWRWLAAEQFLAGKEANATVFAEAAALAVQDIQPLARNAFKVDMLKGAIETALQEALQA